MIQELQGLGKPAHGLRRGEGGESPHPGPPGVGDRLGHIGRPGRLAPVVGEFAYPWSRLALGEIFESFGDGTVGPGAPIGGKLVVESPFDQSIRERVAVCPITISQNLRSDGRVTQVHQVVGSYFRYPYEQVEVEVAPDHRSETKHTVRLGTEGAHALPDDFRMLTGSPAVRRSSVARQRPSSSWKIAPVAAK